MGKKIFLSHASKDEDLANIFVNLLQTGMNIPSNDIFCTSLEGLGVKAGENFIEFIKTQIQNPEVVIALITPSYLESHFCLCELGATWAMQHTFIPLIVRPAKYEHLDGVLATTQALDIENSLKLTEMQEILSKKLGLDVKQAWWMKKMQEFSKAFSAIEIEDFTSVSFELFNKANHKKDEAILESQEAYSKIEELEKYISDLKKCKDKVDVTLIEKKYSSQQDLFFNEANKTRKALEELPRVVREALYYYFSGKDYCPSQFDWDEVEDAIDYKFLEGAEDSQVEINQSHPQVNKAVDDLTNLQRFWEGEGVDAEVFEQISEEYEEENKTPFDFEAKSFWENYLGL